MCLDIGSFFPVGSSSVTAMGLRCPGRADIQPILLSATCHHVLDLTDQAHRALDPRFALSFPSLPLSSIHSCSRSGV